MTNKIVNALLPFELMSKLCALGHCEYYFERLNVYLSNIYVTTVWLIYFVIIFYFEYNKIWISFETTMGYILYNSHLVTTATLIICGMYNKQIYKQCLQQISIINDTLEGLFIPNEYGSLRKKAMRLIIRWILLSLILNATQIAWYSRKATGMKKYLAPFVVNHTLHVNNLIDVLYETLIWYIGSIFEKINKYLLHLSTSRTIAPRKFQRCNLIDTAQHTYSLLTIMHIHLELCNTCHKIHKLFQLSLTAGLVANLLVVVGYSYFQYVHTIKLYHNQFWILPHSIGTVTTLLFFLGKVVLLNSNVENCCKKAHNIGNILDILSDCTNNPERQEEISQFSSQLIHKKLKLSAMGLFYFGHRFLCTYFIVITNYAIITIQLSIT